jgi:hypothetical protein
MQKEGDLPQEGQNSLSYEAPCVEIVLTPEELEREVLYGGISVK